MPRCKLDEENHDVLYLSAAIESKAETRARVSQTDEHEERTESPCPPTCKGTCSVDRVSDAQGGSGFHNIRRLTPVTFQRTPSAGRLSWDGPGGQGAQASSWLSSAALGRDWCLGIGRHVCGEGSAVVDELALTHGWVAGVRCVFFTQQP